MQKSSSSYGLKSAGCKCIRSLINENPNNPSNRFIVGTQYIHEDNELHIIEYNEDENIIENISINNFDSREITDICISPDISLANYRFISTYDYKKNIYSIDLYNNNDIIIANIFPDLNNNNNNSKASIMNNNHIIWNNMEGYYDDLMYIDNNNKSLHHVKLSSDKITKDDHNLNDNNFNNNNKNYLQIKGCWDPHHNNNFVSIYDNYIYIWDIRSNKCINKINNIANNCNYNTSIDYNPNKPYHIINSLNNGTIQIWDLRYQKKPLKLLYNHTDNCNIVKYNRFHDQLLLSCGNDSIINLWKIVSVSSAPLGNLEDPLNTREGDRLIKYYDEHEDSIYDIAWSYYDAWLFASLSYDGRIVINHIPKEEKYKILL